jgi:hypothetical protein
MTSRQRVPAKMPKDDGFPIGTRQDWMLSQTLLARKDDFHLSDGQGMIVFYLQYPVLCTVSFLFLVHHIIIGSFSS